MLLRKVQIRVCDMSWQDQSIVLLAPRLSQLLEFLRSQHFPERVGGINGTIDDNVSNMNSLGRKFRIERLTQHAPPAHGSSM